MAKASRKKIEEEIITEPIVETIEETEISPETEQETIKEEPIFVPDIPAQVVEEVKVVEVEPVVNSGIESETEFLIRLMNYQNNGGWGRHLNPMIKERIELINK